MTYFYNILYLLDKIISMGDDPRNSSYIGPTLTGENLAKSIQTLLMVPVPLIKPLIMLVTIPTLGPLYFAAKKGIKMREISQEKKRLWKLLLEKIEEFGTKIIEYEKYQDAALIEIKKAREANDNGSKKRIRGELNKKATETKKEIDIICKELKGELKSIDDKTELKERFEEFISLLKKGIGELDSPEIKRTIDLPTETESNLRPASATARLGKFFGLKSKDEKQDKYMNEFLENYKSIIELKKQKAVTLATPRDSLMAERIPMLASDIKNNINKAYDPKIEKLEIANSKLYERLTSDNKARIETGLLLERRIGGRISAGAKVPKAKVHKAKVPKSKVPKKKVPKAKPTRTTGA